MIRLKKITNADIECFMEWATDVEVTKHMMWENYSSKKQAEDFFSNVIEKHQWFKAICFEDKVIGSITLEKSEGVYSCKAELGYVLARKYWKHGFATKAVEIAIETGFDELDVERIEALVDPLNIASQRVLEKNAFIKEGLLRNYLIHKGAVKDRLIYSILKK